MLSEGKDAGPKTMWWFLYFLIDIDRWGGQQNNLMYQC
jgi:hypothetical protein